MLPFELLKHSTVPGGNKILIYISLVGTNADDQVAGSCRALIYSDVGRGERAAFIGLHVHEIETCNQSTCVCPLMVHLPLARARKRYVGVYNRALRADRPLDPTRARSEICPRI